ncbi:MAG: type II secretion system F family protein [Chloroflexi bacterium]|nr:type II secretion system F family protein [Chloroflexota bacterium]
MAHVREVRDGQARRAAFPALVDAIGSALGSGLSLELAFAEVAPALPVPLDQGARRVAGALRLGLSLSEALRGLDACTSSEDVAPFAVVLTSFTRSGGRVGRSLARVAALLRGRIALDEERRALTAQGRASALVLVALAPLGATFFALAMPDYLSLLFLRVPVLALVAIVLEIGGALWLARIVRVRTQVDELASLIDAVVVGLDAGLTFEQSLAALVARAPRLRGLPAARRLLADLRLGRGPRTAFSGFAAQGPDEARIAGLVEAASRLGAPLADLLVVQADALRATERRNAETRARRLPILMLFPLTFCVLPALLIVFLGPPLLSLLN